MKASGYIPLVETRRGGIPESIHYGAVAVVDRSGRTIAALGDPGSVTFLRSSAKPLQAIPFLEAGGQEAFSLTGAEVALMCASHSGTDAHVEALRLFQEKIGVGEENLACGVHPSFDQATIEAMLRRGEAPSPIRHNCSGKHTGMLALARLNGWPVEGYLDPDHPVQQAILATFAAMCGLETGQVVVGTDGCSAPNFAVPLRNAALAFARLCDPADLPPTRRRACESITAAMWAEPEMVGGPGRFDTRLMLTCPGRVLTKGGAEGYQALGISPGARDPGSPVLGIALKISDGDPSGRARHAVALEVLSRLGASSADDRKALSEFGPVSPILNQANIQVGEVQPVFQLAV